MKPRRNGMLTSLFEYVRDRELCNVGPKANEHRQPNNARHSRGFIAQA